MAETGDVSGALQGERDVVCTPPLQLCFGRHLSEWRKRVGVPLRFVAEHLGVSVSIICAWERGTRFPSAANLQLISDYTGLSLGELLDEDAERPSGPPYVMAALEVDGEGRILSAGHPRLAASSGEIVGSSLFDRVPSEHHERLRQVLAEASTARHVEPVGIPITAMRRATWWLSRVAPIPRDGQGRRFLVVSSATPTQPVARPAPSLVCERIESLLNGVVRDMRLCRSQHGDVGSLEQAAMVDRTERACTEVLTLVRHMPAPPSDARRPPGDRPAAPSAAAVVATHAEAEVPAQPVASSRPKTVLVADDDPFVTASAHRILGAMGYRVLTAANGPEAVARVRAGSHNVDLVVLDTNMPLMGAVQTFAALKELRPGLKVIVASAHSTDGAATRLQAAGACGFVLKPFSEPALGEIVRNALGT